MVYISKIFQKILYGQSSTKLHVIMSSNHQVIIPWFQRCFWLTDERAKLGLTDMSARQISNLLLFIVTAMRAIKLENTTFKEGIFFKFCQNSSFIKYQKEEVEKQKMSKMVSFVICGTPKLISAIFGQFLAIFTQFHTKCLQLCKISPSSISGTS